MIANPKQTTMSEAGKDPHGSIFLGNPVNLKASGYDSAGGHVAYDPEYECTGGSTNPADRRCPHRLREPDAKGLGLSGWEGRLLHMNMPSYRDPLCPRTLKNLFTKATRPFDIRVRVLQQNIPGEDAGCLEEYCTIMAALRQEVSKLVRFQSLSDGCFSGLWSGSSVESTALAVPETYWRLSPPTTVVTRVYSILTHQNMFLITQTGGGNTSKGGPAGDACPHADQVYIHPINAHDAAGPTYARGLLGQDIVEAYEKHEMSPQDFCMSTDSHMDFEPEWDQKMVMLCIHLAFQFCHVVFNLVLLHFDVIRWTCGTWLRTSMLF